MYRLRCRDCGKRFSVNKLPHQYVSTPKCPDCKSINWRDVNEQDRLYDSKRTCSCGGWPHPHRVGAVVDEYRTCHHADISVVEAAEEAKWLEEELGATSTTMSEKDECPF